MGLPDIVSEAASVAREARRRLMAIIIVAASGIVACSFFTAAAFLALSPKVGTIATCVLLGAFYLVVALAVEVVARSRQSEKRQTSAEMKPGMSDQDAIGHLVSTFMAGLRAARNR